jgi:class 3 adenylate cyclase
MLCLLLLAAVPNQGPAMQSLTKMLDERLQKGDSVDAGIRKQFETPLAVMITDMSGFTELTKKKGILGFMMEIRRLQVLAEPVIDKHKGKWIKADADDLFVVHTHASELFELARSLLAAVDASNKAENNSMGLAIGLGFGKTLLIGDEDIFGDSVNTASKLGEDTAKATEILVSEAFREQMERELKAAGRPMPTCERFEAGTRETKFPFYQCK